MIKYDTLRALADRDPSDVSLAFRNACRFATLSQLCAGMELFLKALHAVLDGEIVCNGLRPSETSNFRVADNPRTVSFCFNLEF